MLQNWAIGKVQWEHYRPEEAMGDGGCHAIGTSIFVQFCGTLRQCQCSNLFNFVSTEDSAIEGGGECNAPVLTPLH